MLKKPLAPIVLMLAASVFLSGCFVTRPKFVMDEDLEHYRTLASSPEPHLTDDVPGHAALSTQAPLVVDEASPPPAWDLSLDDAMRLALENARVLRDLGGNVLRTPNTAHTLSDPAIQASDPRLGMDGALAAFDAQLATKLMAQHNDRAFNNLFLGGGAFLFQQDLDTFDSELSKTTATGATLAVRHHIDYDANNAPANVYPSAWNTNYETEIRQPLLQGGGVEFNRIAGPRNAIGQANGVVIARINNDVSTAEFEIGVRDFVSNLENAYWDLYYAYRDLDAKIAARDTSLNTWRIIHANVEEGRGYSKLQEVQALEQYYRFQEEVLDSLGGRLIERTRTNNGSNAGTFRGVGGVLVAERRLRLWMGLTINDGKLIRPTDEPPRAKVVFEWEKVTQEALALRPELHRQRAMVDRSNMELIAAKNFLLPRFDMIGLYRMRGFGHGWMDSTAPNPVLDGQNALSNLMTGQFQEWQMGFEVSPMPLGFRREHAAEVRNAQMKVGRERALLEEQERQAIHDVADAFGDVPRAYTLMQVAHNRLSAAQDQFRRASDAFFELGGKVSLELVLDARIRLAEAETDYHRARIDYAVALKNVHFEKGSLLEYNGAVLADRGNNRGELLAFAHKKLPADDSQINFKLSNRRLPSEPAATSEKESSANGTEPSASDAVSAASWSPVEGAPQPPDSANQVSSQPAADPEELEDFPAAQPLKMLVAEDVEQSPAETAIDSAEQPADTSSATEPNVNDG